MTTYRVINAADGTTLNHIQVTDNERDDDAPEVADQKRKADAERKRDRWLETEYRGYDLRVVVK